jgi:hypothetical protein
MAESIEKMPAWKKAAKQSKPWALDRVVAPSHGEPKYKHIDRYEKNYDRDRFHIISKLYRA